MRSNHRRERRPVRLGPMETERKLETASSFELLLRRWGFVDRDTKMANHAFYSEFQKVAADLVVARMVQQLKSQGKLTQRGLFSAVRETECALVAMQSADPDSLLRLRARMALNDFRLTPADEERG